MSDVARDKALVDEIIKTLSDRKGFDWWWDGIGSRNRADIKRELRTVARRHIKAAAASPTPENRKPE